MLSLTLFSLWRKYVSLGDMFENNAENLIRSGTSGVFYRTCLVRVPQANLGARH